MLEKAFSAPAFFVLFGVMFLVVAVQRLWGVATAERKGEAILWGSVGVVLAVVFFGLAAWFVTGDAEETQRKQLEVWSRSRLQ